MIERGVVDLHIAILDPYGRLTGYLADLRSPAEGIILSGLDPIAANPTYRKLSDKKVKIGRTEYLVHGWRKSSQFEERIIQVTRFIAREIIDRLIERGFLITSRPTRKTDLLPARVA